MRVFSSGSCRLVTTIFNGRGKIEPIHSMFRNFVGVNFLGKLHNSKQHIQFIKWINDDINLPPYILSSFLTSYGMFSGSRNGMDPLELNAKKKQAIKHLFNDCDFYIFEICSIKLYEKDGYQVQHELTSDYTTRIQTQEELMNDLVLLQQLLPNKKIIIQSHFRPNIIYNDNTKKIENREIIYNILEQFAKTHDSIYIYDPSLLINKDLSMFDGNTHFTPHGHIKNFENIYSIMKNIGSRAIISTPNA